MSLTWLSSNTQSRMQQCRSILRSDIYFLDAQNDTQLWVVVAWAKLGVSVRNQIFTLPLILAKLKFYMKISGTWQQKPLNAKKWWIPKNHITTPMIGTADIWMKIFQIKIIKKMGANRCTQNWKTSCNLDYSMWYRLPIKSWNFGSTKVFIH